MGLHGIYALGLLVVTFGLIGDYTLTAEAFKYAKEFTEPEGDFSGVFRSVSSNVKLTRKKGRFRVEGMTLIDLLRIGGKAAGRTTDCLGRIHPTGVEYEDWDTVINSVEQVGFSLRYKIGGSGVPETTFDDEKRQKGNFRMLGFMASTSVEWLKTFYAASHYGITSVMIHSTTGADGVAHIVNQTKLSVLLTDATQLERLGSMLSELPTLKLVIAIGTVTDGVQQPFAAAGVQVVSWKAMYEMGDGWKLADNEYVPETRDILVISYTSGSTGPPKGVMLTYENVISTAMAMAYMNPISYRVKPGYTQVMYLPLSHVYAMAASLYMHAIGGRLAMWRGDLKLLGDDWKIAKPNVLCVVPAVAKRIITNIETTLETKSKISRWVATKAFKGNRSKPGLLKGSIWDRFFHVTDKINAGLGGNLSQILNAGGKLDAQTQQTLRAYLGVKVLNGYGLTETTGPIVIQYKKDWRTDDILGGPLPIAEYKIKKIAEFSSLKKTMKGSKYIGELYVRGQGVFVGYFRDRAKTREVLGKDRWFGTGDVVEVLPGGGLRMRDRAKSLIKLAQGEYVATEHIEGIYGQSPYIERIWVFAKDSNRMLKAIICINTDQIEQYLKTNDIKGGLSGAMKSGKVQKLIRSELDRIAETSALQKYENINAFELEKVVWQPTGDLLTPTLKLKRPKLKEKYQAEHDKLCANNP